MSGSIHSRQVLARRCDFGPERAGFLRGEAEPVATCGAQAGFEFLEVRGEGGEGRAEGGLGIDAVGARQAGEGEEGGTEVVAPGGVVERTGVGSAQGGEGAIERGGEVGGGTA